jgi:hypothetical protein
LGAIHKAKENSAVQSAHDLALAFVQYGQDNNLVFPGSATSSTAVLSLLVPNYISNADTFYLPVSGKSKLTNAGTLAAVNVCWDVTVESSGDVGLGLNDPTTTPAIFSTGATLNYGTVNTAGAVTVTANNSATNPFASDGIAMAYKDASGGFERFDLANATSTSNTSWDVSSTNFDPPVTYKQLTP